MSLAIASFVAPLADEADKPPLLVALVSVVLVALVLAVLALGRVVPRTRVRVTTCCLARPWPPDDLTGAGT